MLKDPMSKESIFTMKIDSDLRAEFMAEAQAAHRPASQILRELMREFVQRQHQTRDYEAFLNAKIEASRTSMQAGTQHSNDDVEAMFVARRAIFAKQE